MSRKYFYNVMKGAFIEKTESGCLKTQCNEITGHLVNINFKETAHGDAMRLHIIDDCNFYILSMFTYSRPATVFFQVCKNLVLNQEMTFKIRSEDGKDFFTIEQFGGPVLWYFTNENKGELPLVFSDRRPFLISIVENEIIPSLQKKLNPFPYNQCYKPMRKGLQGNYFDSHKSEGKIVGPVSSHEKQDAMGGYGKNRLNGTYRRG